MLPDIHPFHVLDRPRSWASMMVLVTYHPRKNQEKSRSDRFLCSGVQMRNPRLRKPWLLKHLARNGCSIRIGTNVQRSL